MKKSKTLIAMAIASMLIGSCKKTDNPDTATTTTTTTTGSGGPVKDIDGNTYTTVTIGTQVWMKENLKVTKYRNGDVIGTTIPATKDITSETRPKYQWAYNGDESKVATYGRLYTWAATTDSRGVCPTGFGVPTDAEWTTLTTYLGGDKVAADKLKEIGATYWGSANTGATNSSGFSAIPCGSRDYTGIFKDMGNIGSWWSATGAAMGAWLRFMSSSGSNVGKIAGDESSGFSVRCLSKSTPVDNGTVTDIDGNVYKTIKIGTQVWMAENLKVTHYRTGTAIPTVTNDSAWYNIETNVGAYCNYNNDAANVNTYGRLYNFYAAHNQNLAPAGWHVPTDAEWVVLGTYLGSGAGGKLKEIGTTHWASPNTGATNSSGFTALPGGSRGDKGAFGNIGVSGRWWSTTEETYTHGGWNRSLYSNSSDFNTTNDISIPCKMSYGLSVRCIKD